MGFICIAVNLGKAVRFALETIGKGSQVLKLFALLPGASFFVEDWCDFSRNH